MPGWGNRPDAFDAVLDDTSALAATPDATDHLDATAQDALITRLLSFNQWDYVLRTQPTVIVLDTRTRRWHSRRLPSRPSGLMDWESLTDLQHELLDETAAVIVSPTPMFGVKLIEVVQRLCTFAGHALTVDAENWMTHRGSASVMLNIFRHSRTPGNYVILSGDVHYSFAYDVQVRDRDRSPHIWQITSSGIKNEFPRRLLDWLDRLNRWLYSPRSPLNWFTQRRHLQIQPRLPDQRRSGERLWNGAGIGQILLDAQVDQHAFCNTTPTAALPPNLLHPNRPCPLQRLHNNQARVISSSECARRGGIAFSTTSCSGRTVLIARRLRASHSTVTAPACRSDSVLSQDIE
ncbi:metallophosphoesterase family protein [Advenella kashmirensis]|uniref:hypothetical protein n=1 Tax=Advenella kashmirensis TaxID=310575 RepID=UPI001EE6928F|nr:hypothetical protein [Advenella kashmirensis]